MRRTGAAAGVACLAVVALAAPQAANGQAFGGSASLNTELYYVDGREARRPPMMGRLTVSPSLDLWGISLGLNLTYDTESSYTVRSLNRYALSPSWSWGTLYIGDHAPAIGELMLQGTTVRGAGLELSPGPVRLRFHRGRADDAVFTDPLGFGTVDDRRFDVGVPFSLSRRVYAGSARLGSDRNHVEILAFQGHDQHEVPDTLSLMPAENLVLGLAMAFEPRRGWRLGGTVYGSIHSLDRRLEPIADFSARAEIGWPGGVLDRIHPIRPGTHGDLAYRVDAEAPLPWGGLRLRLEEIGPGYTSLGIPSLPNNWRSVEGTLTLALLGGRLAGSLGGGWRGDGLVDDGAGQTDRMTVNTVVSYQAGPALGLVGSVMLNQLERRAAVDTFALVNVARSVTLAPRYTPRGGESPHGFSIQASWQETETKPGVLAPFGAQFVSLGVGYDYSVSPAMSIGVQPSLVRSSDPEQTEQLLTGAASASYRPPGSPLALSVTASGGESVMGGMAQLAGNGRYDLGPMGALALNLRGSAYFGDLDYREFAMSVGLARSF